MHKKLSLIIDKDCKVCKRTIKELKKFKSKRNDIKIEVITINEYAFKNISIVPALLIDGKLFCYGDIDFRKLKQRL